ncbi:MAG: mechanosensitive ion channel [Clostridia bacterium]|nr:mechanosensitive ion channel [Clostridia bacterium]
MLFKMFLTETAEQPIVDWHALLDKLVEWTTSVGVKIIIALIIMFISFKIINWLTRKIEKLGEKPNHDKTIMRTLAYLARLGGKCVVAICLIGYLGIDTSALTALIASLGVCIGLAVNGAVSNIAGGVLILVTRPFKVDDFIEAQGYSGTVQDIHLTNTKLITGDNKVVYIPNGPLSSGNIVNYSEKDQRRVDLNFSIGYQSDYAKARQLITDIFTAHELVLKDKDITVRASEHGDSAINLIARAWVNSGDYWTVYFDVLDAVKEAFDREGIEMPYNQLDVHIRND